MAGAFTHMVLATTAVDQLESSELMIILNHQLKWVIAGAVGPDMPYLSYINAIKMKSLASNWADIMHYHNTDVIVNLGVRTLRLQLDRTDAWKKRLAWLCGYATHIIADATVHPVVELIAGPCTEEDSMPVHHECESFQDSIIMKEVLNMEVTNCEFTNFLRECGRDGDMESVMSFWAQHAKVACPVFGRPDPKSWFDSYLKVLDSAEGDDLLRSLFRHATPYIYNDANTLRNNEAGKCRKYYDNVPLPSGGYGSFYDVVYKRTMHNIITLWHDIESAILGPDNNSGASHVDIIGAFNLDNGYDYRSQSQACWA